MRALEGKEIDSLRETFTKTYITMEQELPSDHKSNEQKDRHAVIPSMKRRMKDKDYQERSIYMLTFVVAERRKLFGRIEGDIHSCHGEVNYPHIVLTSLGEAVKEQIVGFPRFYPQITVCGFQIMPDHLHLIIFVRETLPCHLGIAIRGFIQGCNKAYRRLFLSPQQEGRLNSKDIRKQYQKRDRRGNGLLFEHGYNDKVLMHKDQLQIWRHYLADNPRRLLIKQTFPDFFRVQRNIEEKGITYSAIGNRFLLNRPLLQVQCSRRLSEEEIQNLKARALTECASGTVLVSPCISPGEKAVMRTAFEKGYPEIILQENGFTALAKPGGACFDACARGQLLLLAPWEHHTDKRLITRLQCNMLNNMAAALCNGERL